MPFVKRQGSSSEIDPKLKRKRQQIIEEERIRVLKESLMLFYDKLMDKYELIHLPVKDAEVNENESDSIESESVNRVEVEAFAVKYAKTKPLGF